jgi:ACS family hexuronate transporter-like MFS transporter
MGFRFFLGLGESGNWPGATKAVSEWFPKQERGLATALFDSGSSIGGAVAPFVVLWLYFRWGLRPAFIVPGLLGFLWLIAWRWLYLLFGLATFSYASFTTIANVLPSDLYWSESVATVSGLSGTGAALGTIVVFELAGRLSDARIATGTHLFDPLMVIAGLIPFVGMTLVLLLVRNTKATDQGLVRRI